MTAFSDLTAAIVAGLAAAPALCGGRVYRGHAWPLAEADSSMAWVRPTTSSSERAGITGGPTDWTTSYEVEVRVRYAPDTESPDAAVDAIIGEIYSRCAVLSLPGVMDVVPGTTIEWDYLEADLNVCGAVLRLDVIHRTEAATLTAW